MRTNIFSVAGVGTVCLLLVIPPLLGSRRHLSSVLTEESAIRRLIADWVDAYQNFDARRLAALETPEVETVDRFGELHLPSGREQNEKLWSDAFEIASRNVGPPKVTVDHIRFLRPDVAVVRTSWRFAEGILFVDGARFPPFSEFDTYIVIKSHNAWLIAAHNMQEKQAGVGPE